MFRAAPVCPQTHSDLHREPYLAIVAILIGKRFTAPLLRKLANLVSAGAKCLQCLPVGARLAQPAPCDPADVELPRALGSPVWLAASEQSSQEMLAKFRLHDEEEMMAN